MDTMPTLPSLKSALPLRHHRLYEETGFDPRNQYFTRYCEDKAVVVEKEFGGATYFVDDGLQVLVPMVNVVSSIGYSTTPRGLA